MLIVRMLQSNDMESLNVFLYFNLAVGIVAMLIGVGAMVQPQAMSLKFGIAADSKALPYVVSLGIRDIFMGATVLLLFFLSQWFALGLVHIFLGVVAASDFRVVFKNGIKKTSLVHLAGAIVSMIYGVWLSVTFFPL